MFLETGQAIISQRVFSNSLESVQDSCLTVKMSKIEIEKSHIERMRCCNKPNVRALPKHRKTNAYIYIYIYIYVPVFLCLCRALILGFFQHPIRLR